MNPKKVYIKHHASGGGAWIYEGYKNAWKHLGYEVSKLDRVYYAGLTKKNLARGQWRFLTEEEVNLLKMTTLNVKI